MTTLELSREHEGLASERELLRRYAKDRDPRLRAELIERLLPLARSLASRYGDRSEPFDDLVQAANEGLIKALDRFDPDRGTAFSTYAVPTILGELRRHFRDRTWIVHVPRGLQERVLKVEKAIEELPVRLGRAVTVADIAERIKASEDEVLEALHASHSRYTNSFDEPGSDPEDGPTLGDHLGEEDPGFDLAVDGIAVKAAMENLPDRLRDVLALRFGEGLTQREIAARIGVSQMHVSRLLRQAIDEVREQMPAVA